MLAELQSLPVLVIGQLLFFLALGPVMYLLISYLAYAKEGGPWQSLWHVTPILLSLVLAKSATQIIVFGTILQVCYTVASIRLIRSYHRASFSCRSDAETTKLSGLFAPLSVIGFMSFITFAVLAQWIVTSAALKGLWLVLDLYISLFMLLWIVAKVIWSKRIFKGLREYELTLDEKVIAITTEQRKENKGLFNSVEDSLRSEHFYNDSALSLTGLAELTGHDAQAISLAISQEAGLNFCDFINGHRVGAVQRCIDEGQRDMEVIHRQAMESGFVTIKSFSSLFRRFVGNSPEAYVEAKRDV